MAGLVKSWVYAILSLFILYVMFALTLPIMSYIDNAIFTTMNSIGISPDYLEIYLTWAPTLRNFVGYVSIGLFIGLIIYLVLSAAVIEPNEWRQ